MEESDEVPRPSPGLPLRLPWVWEFQSAATPMGLLPHFICHLSQRSCRRQRWAGGRNRFAAQTQFRMRNQQLIRIALNFFGCDFRSQAVAG